MGIGVLVEDRWQRSGIGNALVRAMSHKAQALALPGLTATLLTTHSSWERG